MTTDIETTLPDDTQAEETDMAVVLEKLNEISQRLAVLESRPVAHTEDAIKLMVRAAVDEHPRIRALDNTVHHFEGMVDRVESIAKGIQTTFSTEILNRVQSQKAIDDRLTKVEAAQDKAAGNIDRVITMTELRIQHGQKQDEQIGALSAKLEKFADEAREGHVENQRMIRVMLPLATSLMGRDPFDPEATRIGDSIFERFDRYERKFETYETEQKASIASDASIRQTLTVFTEQQRSIVSELKQDAVENKAFRQQYQQSQALKRMVWNGIWKAVQSTAFKTAFGLIFSSGLLATIYQLFLVLTGGN